MTIALITSLGPNGAVHAAPYSLFNVMGHDPAVAMVSVLAHPEARLKDTANNVLATKEFVINLVSEGVAEAMNITCIDAPPGINELELANLKTTPSVKVKPPRVTTSPVAFGVASSLHYRLVPITQLLWVKSFTLMSRTGSCATSPRFSRYAGVKTDWRYA